MSEKNARLKSLYSMGQTSSQVAEHNPDGKNGRISDGVEERAGDEVAMEAPKKRKKRKSSGASDGVDNTQAVGDRVEGRGRAKRKKKKKKKKGDSGEAADIPVAGNHEEENRMEPSRVEEPDAEEAESARALLQLRNDTQRDGAKSPNEDDFPGNGQLVPESSPANVRPKSKKPDAVGVKPTEVKRSKKKANRRQSATQEQELNGNASSEETEPGLPQMSAAHKASTYQPNPSVNKQVVPQSTLSLDDIDSNDEALASYLQTYENGELGTRFHGDPQEDSLVIDDSYTQLANDAFNEAIAAALLAEHTTPLRSPPSRENQKGSKSGRKRNSNLPESIFASDDEQPERSLDKPEQPPQKRRYKKRASKHGLDVDGDDGLPVEPRHSIPGLSTMQIDNYEHPDLNVAGALQRPKPGKLKRPAKAMLGGSNVQSSNLDGFVTRNQNLPPSTNNTDDEEDQVVDDSDPNLDPELFPSAQKQKKRRVDPIQPPNTSKPTFKVSKGLREAIPSSQLSQESKTSINAQNLTIGPFTKAEGDLIRAWRESYCAEHQWSHHKFDETVQMNARNDNTLIRFWDEICAQIPYRPRQAVQKHCRRNFHNFEKRGTWTPEDDATLKRAVAEKGTSWKAISVAMGRMQEDVRDRWRNYLNHSENRNKEAWSEAEVLALIKAVGECVWLIHNQLQEDGDAELQREGVALDLAAGHMTEEKLEKLVNWQIVSDRMQGQRSRLQCSYKWGRLKRMGRVNVQKAARKAERWLQRYEEDDFRSSRPSVPDWRARKARKKVQKQMLRGDKLDLLQALTRQRAKDEMHVAWSSLGKGEPWRERWLTLDLKVAWIMMRKEMGEEAPVGDRFFTVVNALIEKLLVEQPKPAGEYRWFLQEQASHEGGARMETELENLLAPLQEELRGGARLPRQQGDGEQSNGPAEMTEEELKEYERKFDNFISNGLKELKSGTSQAAGHASQQGELEMELDDIADADFLDEY